MDRERKAAVVEELAAQLEGAGAIFAVDYRGIGVSEAAELRGKLAEAEATFRVVKNRLAKRAVQSAGTDEIDSLLDGPTALAFVRGDPVTAAKAIAEFARRHNVPTYKGGLMEGAALDPEQFGRIARLPGRDQLQGQLVAMVASPISGVARGLSQLLAGLASQLGQVQEQGLIDGGAEDSGGTERTEAEPSPAEPEARAKDSAGDETSDDGAKEEEDQE